MSSMSDMDTQSDSMQDDRKQYGIRNGTIFIIDATEPMFNKVPDDEQTYFQLCIQQYAQILRKKLSWNRQDWMGLILLGTEEWDTDPEIKHILTLQQLGLVSVEKLKQAMNIYQEKWKHYKSITSSKSYPLYDALWHAAQIFSTVNIVMPDRKVIFFTCQDVPPTSDTNEKHRIRVKASAYNNIGIELIVVGLGKNWNHNAFYKDIEMLSRNIANEDYRRASLTDIVESIIMPSSNIMQLPWRFGKGVTLNVSIRSLCSKTDYLKKVRVSKDTNMPLVTGSYMRRVCRDNQNELGESGDEDEEVDSVVFPSDIRKTQTYGGRVISFTPMEVKALCNTRDAGIDVICVKPVQFDPMYHFKAPYFVICSKKACKDDKLLFSAMLDKCESRNLMIICGVTIRRYSSTVLYRMIPNAEMGGFYLYRIPFKENVRDLREHLASYVYDDGERKPPPVEPKDTALYRKIIRKLRMKYDPSQFPNPKLQVQRQNIETLALDLERRPPPPDETLPPIDVMKEKVGYLVSQVKEHFRMKRDDRSEEDEGPNTKRYKRSNDAEERSLDEETIRVRVKNGTLAQCTLVQLKNFIKSMGWKTSTLRTKADVIAKLKEYFSESSN